MEMTEVFDKLKALQEILAERYELESAISESPRRLGNQEELLSRMKGEYVGKNKDYEDLKEKVGKLRVELTETEAIKESGEKGMDNISTHREYEALEKQINDARAKEAEIRRELQKEEKRLADIDEQLRSYEDMISAQETDLAESRARLNKEIGELGSRLEELKRSEAELIPGVDPEIVFKFQRIIQRNRDGIVSVKGNVCGGCHMILPAQFANQVRDGEDIVFCPYCSRILYYQENSGEGGAADFYLMDDIGSLADDDEEPEDQDDSEEEGQEDEDADSEKTELF